MLLNCDLGESFGSWKMGLDEHVMPHIDMANIACGFHGGDPLTLSRTLNLARQHGVEVGAHPAYPDLVGFGRRSMRLDHDELVASLHYQVAALDGMARCAGLELSYVKPHGALYNDMMADAAVRLSVFEAISGFHRRLKLVLLATKQAEVHREEAADYGIDLIFEAFADRRYDDDGHLLSRASEGAVHGRDDMLDQVRSLLEHGVVITASGRELSLTADTLCVHGDNEAGVRAIREIRAVIEEHK